MHRTQLHLRNSETDTKESLSDETYPLLQIL